MECVVTCQILHGVCGYMSYVTWSVCGTCYMSCVTWSVCVTCQV